jgi:hypothetical protein
MCVSVSIVSKLPATVAEDRNALQDALALLGWDDYQPPDQDRLAFRWECDWQPTHGELDALILQVAGHGSADNRNERIGIRFSRDSRTYWLDQEPVRASIVLPDELETALDWGPNELHKAWVKAKGWVLAHPCQGRI